MTTNAFLVWAPESTVPLIVYAPNADEAADTYALWSAIQMPAWSRKPDRVEEVSLAWLQEQPQLSDAVQRAVDTGMHDAVLLFLGHETGWIAVPTYAGVTGRFAPIEPRVRFFQVRSDVEEMDGIEVLVFAHDVTHALALYLEYRETFFGPVSHHYQITEAARWTLTGVQTVLREEMDMGMVGIAGWSPTKGWAIYPATHEMAGE